jgi:hypothetical protein
VAFCLFNHWQLFGPVRDARAGAVALTHFVDFLFMFSGLNSVSYSGNLQRLFAEVLRLKGCVLRAMAV